jgi:hypothetical protein
MKKQRAKRKSLVLPQPQRCSDFGTIERARHGGVAVEPAETARGGTILSYRVRAQVECVLDGYHLQGRVNDREWEAGLHFRRLWETALRTSSVTAIYGPRGGDGGGKPSEETETQARARHEVRDALDTLRLTERAVVISVCGMDERAGGTRRLDALSRGLEALAARWRIGKASA